MGYVREGNVRFGYVLGFQTPLRLTPYMTSSRRDKMLLLPSIESVLWCCFLVAVFWKTSKQFVKPRKANFGLQAVRGGDIVEVFVLKAEGTDVVGVSVL